MELSMKKTTAKKVWQMKARKKDDPTRKFGGLYGDTCKSRAPQGHTKDASKPLLHVALSQPEEKRGI